MKYILKYKEIIKEDVRSCLVNIDNVCYRYFPRDFCEINEIKKTIICPGWFVIENGISDCLIGEI